MRNFLLGVLICYFIVGIPKAKAGINGDIQSIVSSLLKIATSVVHIEHMMEASKHCKLPVAH